MLIITSGIFAVSELCAEFGNIPPCFLPIGNKRLYEFQIEWAKQFYKQIVLTLPDTFDVPVSDQRRLDFYGITVIRCAQDQMLHHSLSQVLNQHSDITLVDILFGDTFFPDLVPVRNSLAISVSDENYNWHSDTERSIEKQGCARVWSGFFSFLNGQALRACLLDGGSFIDAVEKYSQNISHLLRVNQDTWLDFGHVHTFFSSRQKITTQRYFNSLHIDNGVLTKKSTDPHKMIAESSWYKNLPSQLRIYTPIFVDETLDAQGNCNGYQLEYCPLLPLNELYVFGRLPLKIWVQILSACETFLVDLQKVPTDKEIDQGMLERLYLTKTQQRLAAYAADTGMSLTQPWVFNGVSTPSIDTIVKHMWELIQETPPITSFTHGDFCFSNILYDFRSRRIRVIDPRGVNPNGEICPFSDLRYDIAKFAHSVIGKYDFIIANRFELDIGANQISFNFTDTDDLKLSDWCKEQGIASISLELAKTYPIMVLLFLSMIPLHKDQPKKQLGFLANALRLYLEFMQ